jgi:hypothetical protein
VAAVTNRPKDIGTRGESQVVGFLREHGFPNSERRALRGTKDVGDITGTPGIVWEVKAGEAARTASDNQVDLWLAETDLERDNDGAQLGLLVMARRRHNVRTWWAVMHADDLVGLLSDGAHGTSQRVPVRMTLQNAVRLLRDNGYGEPVDYGQLAEGHYEDD